MTRASIRSPTRVAIIQQPFAKRAPQCQTFQDGKRRGLFLGGLPVAQFAFLEEGFGIPAELPDGLCLVEKDFGNVGRRHLETGIYAKRRLEGLHGTLERNPGCLSQMDQDPRLGHPGLPEVVPGQSPPGVDLQGTLSFACRFPEVRQGVLAVPLLQGPALYQQLLNIYVQGCEVISQSNALLAYHGSFIQCLAGIQAMLGLVLPKDLV